LYNFDPNIQTSFEFNSWQDTQTIPNSILSSYFLGTNDPDCPIFGLTVGMISNLPRPTTLCMINLPTKALEGIQAQAVVGVGFEMDVFKIEVHPSLIPTSATYEYLIESQGYTGAITAGKVITIKYEKINDNCLGGVLQSPGGTVDRKEFTLNDPGNKFR